MIICPCPYLTHWGRVRHICVCKLTIISSNNGLSPGRRQAIIWTNVGIVLIRALGTNFSEISNQIHTFSLKKMHLEMPSAKWRQFCPHPNVLNYSPLVKGTPVHVKSLIRTAFVWSPPYNKRASGDLECPTISLSRGGCPRDETSLNEAWHSSSMWHVNFISGSLEREGVQKMKQPSSISRAITIILNNKQVGDWRRASV